MHGQRPNVLPLYDRPRQKTYRAAIARVIREIKAREHLSNVELAEEIGCSPETISNAENENNDLSAVILLNLAFRFGEAAIDPVRELYLCRHVDPPSLTDRFDEIERDIAALRKELAQ